MALLNVFSQPSSLLVCCPAGCLAAQGCHCSRACVPAPACLQDGKFHLILVESRIHRLARYYKKSKKLPPNWKYESATASALVQG